MPIREEVLTVEAIIVLRENIAHAPLSIPPIKKTTIIIGDLMGPGKRKVV